MNFVNLVHGVRKHAGDVHSARKILLASRMLARTLETGSFCTSQKAMLGLSLTISATAPIQVCIWASTSVGATLLPLPGLAR